MTLFVSFATLKFFIETPTHIYTTNTTAFGSRHGFAVVYVLLILLFMALLTTTLALLNETENASTRQKVKKDTAENAAMSAAKIALAELQYLAGRDDCATAPLPYYLSQKEKVVWTGVWQSHNPPPFYDSALPEHSASPLVSCFGDFSKTSRSVFPKNKVTVPWEYIGDDLRISYFIEDLSTKVSLLAYEPDEYLAGFKDKDDLCDARQISPRRVPFEKLFKLASQDESSFRSHLKRTFGGELLFEKCGGDKAFSDAVTLLSCGVVVNPKTKALKKNFQELKPFYTESFFSPDADMAENPDAGTIVATSLPKGIGVLSSTDHVFPIIPEIKLHIGLFNPRTDGQHRARFHISTRLWNPFPFPMLTVADAQFGIIDFSNMPGIVIQNKNTGSNFSFSLSEFPTANFGLVRQTRSDATFNAYCKIFDTSDQSFGSVGKYPDVGLHPGEVFLAVFPDPKAQPSGLARNTGGPSWKFQKNANPDKPPSGAVDGRWFHAEHSISIFSMPNFRPTSISIRHYNGSLQQNKLPSDYSPETFVMKNIVFPHFAFNMSGADYNRATSGDYDISQASIVFRIRLKTEDPAAMKTFFNAVDLRSGVFDFARKEVADAFDISVETKDAAAKCAKSETSPQDEYFWDESANSHGERFAQAILFDRPNRAHISAGTLRHAHHLLSGIPAFALGSPSTSTSINSMFDTVMTESDMNPNSINVGMCVNGAFNINSDNPASWTLALSNSVPAWRVRPRGKPGAVEAAGTNPVNLKNVFFRRPFSAQSTSANSKIFSAMSDDKLEKLSKLQREVVMLSQGFREISDKAVSSLGNAVAKRIQKHNTEFSPFKTISEFVDSGIIDNAIKDAGINTIAGDDIPEWFPCFITQGDVVQSLAPNAFPRGDTFRIVARAEILNRVTALTDAVSGAELIVQRVPDFFDNTQSADIEFKQQNAINRVLGRRFVVISARLLSADDL